jgi:hypothetical protein
MTVAGCMLTLFLAITHPDYLVQDAVVDPARQESAAPDTAR